MNEENSINGVVGDIGGTNARFAKVRIDAGGQVDIEQPLTLKARDFKSADDALAAFIEEVGSSGKDFILLACAGPVRQSKVVFTNLDWSLDAEDMRSRLNAGPTFLLNDLEALAWAAPRLKDIDLRPVGDGRLKPGRIAVLGAGTGANCSVYGTGPNGPVVMVGEAGHIGFAPRDEEDADIWRRLRQRFGRVSIERVASGPGILNIYRCLCEMAGENDRADSPEGVSLLAGQGDPIAVRAIDRFCRILGDIAGDFALSFGADAVFIAGGLAPQVLVGTRATHFRVGFEDKGRFSEANQAIPTFVITHPYPALIGAAHAAHANLRASA